MRAQVTNLWALGDIVRSGVVVDSTRVGVVGAVVNLFLLFFYVLQLVFRSLSAQLFLGIQISSEMWEFDPQGEREVSIIISSNQMHLSHRLCEIYMGVCVS